MKKSIFVALLLSIVASVSAQSTGTCFDIQVNLTRGTESKNVLGLQNFLYSKGFLKATPNGYFGPGTFQAVKLYQKSVGLPNTGAVLSMTRLSIKNATCTSLSSPLGNSSSSPSTGTSVVTSRSSSTPITSIVYPRPAISSLEKGTLFKGGVTTWGVTINGSSFSSTTNIVYIRNRESGRKYKIGTFSSADQKTVLLPPTLTKDSFSCGNNCFETLPTGTFDLTVENEGGESDPIFLTIKAFSISSVSGSVYAAVPNGPSQLLGTISFAGSEPLYVSDIDIAMVAEGFLYGGGVSGLTFKDELTGKKIDTFGQIAADENQSKIIGIYGNVDAKNGYGGTITVNGTITIMDYVGKKPISFPMPQFLTSLLGY
jgi:peptidoglycan hydrolase-like protein with peptidoglycan-binding domain